VRGRTVEVRLLEEKADPIKGELLALDSTVLLVLAPRGALQVPRGEIERVRVQLHGLGGAKAGAWAVAGALVTGGALALACASVDDADNCGAFFAGTAVLWGLIGGPSAAGLARSSRVFIERSELDSLRPYARFPQGMPEGLDPAALLPPAPAK
jgi:hypothetical protein